MVGSWHCKSISKQVPFEKSWPFNGRVTSRSVEGIRMSYDISIPAHDNAAATISLCTELARKAAEKHQLGFWDPQAGAAEY
jgi:hypothetical protein